MSRINTNVSAMNTQRLMGQTNEAFGRTVGRLSSGFRINRAADDAAGLGIANKLRADIGALGQASRNATQANSLLQVAEGAITQLSAISDRMKTLAVQSASDSVNDDSRALIQAEFAELQQEIDRIVNTTKFQGETLLDGTFGETFTVNAGGFEAADIAAFEALDAVEAASFSVANESGLQNGAYTVTVSGTNNEVITLSNADGSQAVNRVLALDGSQDVDGDQQLTFVLDGATISFTISGGATTAERGDLNGFELNTDVNVTGSDVEFMVSVSGNQASDDNISIATMDVSRTTLGLDNSISLGSKSDAVTAIGAIDDAIKALSETLGDIGAAQNRLSFASANVDTTIENFAAAESVIRDADFAAEATEFARLQILQQAQVAMLAQANSAPQGVLRLIQ